MPTMRFARHACVAMTAVLACLICVRAQADDPWIVIQGDDESGKGKPVVLISGDEEYRSEEAL
ncbi:MAG: hypothetical protein JO329_12500, partial [Planctomycetaceae bacterium]|nr:hypothetical protein [Planctomycetaceae bacterium]